MIITGTEMVIILIIIIEFINTEIAHFTGIDIIISLIDIVMLTETGVTILGI